MAFDEFFLAGQEAFIPDMTIARMNDHESGATLELD
jgi:hypothetical protein